MEENFRRVPPPPRPFIPRPPQQNQQEEAKEVVNTQQQVNDINVEQLKNKAKKESKPINPKIKLGLLIAGAILCFGGAIACCCLILL